MPRKTTTVPRTPRTPGRKKGTSKTGGRKKGSPNKTAVETITAPRTPMKPGRKKGTPKTGGRKKGSLNKTTVAMKDAMLSVYADLQADAGGGNGHFLDWARGNSTDFYRLASRLLPLQVSGESGGPVVTRIELVGLYPEGREDR